MSRIGVTCAVALVLASLATRAAGADVGATPATEAKTRASLVWIFGDDDVFGRAGATTPPSPAGSIGDRPGYDALFEGLSSRYTGRENRLELRWGGQAGGVHPALSTSAELALGVDASALGSRDGTLRFEDVGSHLELFWRFTPVSSESGAGLRLYPLHGDRERLGQLEALGVGGEVGPERESPYAGARDAVRAGRFWLELYGVRAFVVVKTAGFVEPLPEAPAVQETSYAVFGGVESAWRRVVSFGLGFGHFEHGRLPSAGGPAPRATTTAASARLAFGRGLGAPLAPASFANEPPPFDAPREAAAASGWALGVEGAHILQRLVLFENPAETALAGARALAAVGTLRAPPFELRLALLAREAGFVMRNVPGIFPGQTTPRAAAELAELGALASGAVATSKALRVSLDAGVRRPAAVVTRAFDRDGRTVGATALLEGPGEGVLLPAGELPVPVVDVRPRVELRASQLLEFVAWVSYRRDYNRVRLVADASGQYVRGFADPNRFGYGLAARAVW